MMIEGKKIQIDPHKFLVFRTERGMQIIEIAEKLGVSRRTIHYWIENGWPDARPSMFSALAKVFRTKRSHLLRNISAHL